MTVGSDRMNELFAGWAIPYSLDSKEVEGQSRRLRQVVVELNALLGDASSAHVLALSEANEQVGGAIRDLLNARKVQDLMVAQSRLTANVVANFAVQAGALSELTNKVHRCCLAAFSNSADSHSHALETSYDTKRPVRKGRSKPRVRR